MPRTQLPPSYKRLSALRRVGDLGRSCWDAIPGFEGYIGLFQLQSDAGPISVEAESGRSMTVVPGDVFLATPGYRELVHWTVGGVPAGGLEPGEEYWVLSESGVIGSLMEASVSARDYLGRVRYLGAVVGPDGQPLRLRDFAISVAPDAIDAGAPVYLILGTSVEVGKTTAGLTLLRTLLEKGHSEIVVLKATGTTSVTELRFTTTSVLRTSLIALILASLQRFRAEGLTQRRYLVGHWTSACQSPLTQ